MKYCVTHKTEYAYSETAPVCHNLLHLAPRITGRQTRSEHRLTILPTPAYTAKREDCFGNQTDYFSIHQSHERLSITSTSRIEILSTAPMTKEESPAWEQLAKEIRIGRSPATLEAYAYSFPSPCIPRSGDLAAYATSSFPPGRPILSAITELNERIHDEFEYDPKATSVSTPVHEALAQRRGVCQDFAHIAIGCLRSLGLPARYVSGYLRTNPPPGKPRLVGADASHAWFSAYVGWLGWIDFDPTNRIRTNADHITLAWGRDYADVAPVRGVFVASGQTTMSVSVDVEPLD